MSWLVGFDFDGCLHDDGLPIDATIAAVHRVADDGGLPFIVTSRTASHENPTWYMRHEPDRVLVWPFVERHSLPVHGVVFCSHARKTSFLFRMGITTHYDNDPLIVADCNANGIEGILIGVQT